MHSHANEPPQVAQTVAPARRRSSSQANLLDLQRTAGNAAVAAAVGRSPVLDVVGSGGQTLPGALRADMEGRFGTDFSDVRVHTGGAAAASAAAVSAHAYTVGSHIVFGAGGLDGTSTSGRTTLAHELTHVVQQRSGPVSGTPTGDGISVSDPGDRFEREAAVRAASVLEAPGRPGGVVQPPHPTASPGVPGSRVQRRVPDPAAIPGDLAADTPVARASQKKLKQLLRRTIDRLEQDVPGARAAITASALAAGAQVDVALDEATHLPQPDQLTHVSDAIKDYQRGRQDKRLNEVEYPGVDVPALRGPAGGEIRALDDAVAEALVLMRGIGANDAALITVFGGKASTAASVFALAAAGLDRLHRKPAIQVGGRGDSEAMSAGGLTNPASMSLPPAALTKSLDELVVTLVHESTHAISGEQRTSDDFYIDWTADSSFLTATESHKIRLAPHYEAVARIKRGLVQGNPVFTPRGNAAPDRGAVSTEVANARAWAQTKVTRAWTVAINAHDWLLEVAQDLHGNRPTSLPKPELVKKLPHLSRNLGLTIHYRTVPDGADPVVTVLDLAIAQDRATSLAGLMNKAAGFTAAEDRGWLASWFGTTEYLGGKILDQVIAAHGFSRKDAERERDMILALASTYDAGRVTVLLKRVVPPLQEKGR
ncbi:MAG: DUF4157 domain-containing protein [Promicromonosporaceae bacterium]|nr:DUF4157 domain-containing protein [Promicromonosporaceae bacterium]